MTLKEDLESKIEVGYEDEFVEDDWYVKITIPKGKDWIETQKKAVKTKSKILQAFEDAEKYNKSIEFWQEQGLTRDEAIRFHRDFTRSNIAVTHEVYTENETLKSKIKQLEDRLNETIDWIDSQLGFLASNDKERYVNFEWLKSHLISIRDNENRSELKLEIERSKK